MEAGAISRFPGAGPGSPITCRKTVRMSSRIRVGRTSGSRGVAAAWYEREIDDSENLGRSSHCLLSVEYLNSLAVAWVDGKRAGELRFPGGDLDITSLCGSGETHRLTLHVSAVPLKGVLLSYSDSNSAREVQGRVARRGLCGDVFLQSEPVGERITDVKVDTSVRNRRNRFRVRA